MDLWNATLPYRIALGVGFFAVLGGVDWLRNREDPRRAKEYLFLAFSTAVAVAYGVAQDHVAATISPAYFLEGKGLAGDPRPYRVAVTVLAIQATYWVGLIAGVALLLANNPSPARPQLGYGELARLVAWPLATAAAAAVLGAALFAIDAFDLRETAREIAGPSQATRFLVVWGVNTGAYAGGALGTVAAGVAVVRRRRRLASPARRARSEGEKSPEFEASPLR